MEQQSSISQVKQTEKQIDETHQQQSLRIIEPIYIMTKKMLTTCNPKTIDHRYLKDFKLKQNTSLATLNNTRIDSKSPKTSRALQDLGITSEQLELLDKQVFKINGENQELLDKRYLVHYFQIAQLRKKVILQRNQYKREEWIEKQERSKSIPQMDQSLNSSININEYTPYKSPTEMIENWIDSHVQLSDQRQSKFSQIQQRISQQEQKKEEESIQYKQKLDTILEKKSKNRQNNLKQKSIIARKDISKSQEISKKMKTIIQEEQFKKAEKRKLQTEQNIEKAQKRVDKLKQSYIDELEEKQKMYEQKLQNVQKKKQENEESQYIQRKLEQSKTERSQNQIKYQQNNNKRKSDEWSQKLPLIVSRSEAQFQNIYNSNLVQVIEQFKKDEKKKIKSNKSKDQEKNEQEEKKLKEESFKQRITKKFKVFEDKMSKLEEKFAKKDQYLIEYNQKKQNDLDEKFDKIRELSMENDRRFQFIKQEYTNKCDKQMNKEQSKFKSNMNLLKQREQIIYQLRYKRFQDKTKSSIVSLQGENISKINESKILIQQQ